MVIPEWNYTNREKTVVDILGEGHMKIKSFLNIGFRGWRNKKAHWWINICEANDVDWNIMEIFQPNIDDAIRNGCDKNRIFRGDVLNTSGYGSYDCILFWHGPEHVDKDRFLSALKDIEDKANEVLIFGMPLGKHPQGPAHGNKHEEHISSWGCKDWRRRGYSVIPVYSRRGYPHITAYKVFD